MTSRNTVKTSVSPSELRARYTHGPAVYFMQFGDRSSPIKIGFTCNMGARLAVLSSAHWEPLRLLAATNGDRSLEKKIHARFARHRVSGEWFHAASEILGFAEELDKCGLTLALRESIDALSRMSIDALYAGTKGMRCPRCGRE